MSISFATKTDYLVLLSAGTNSIAVADMNADGIVDLVTANQNLSKMGTFLGKGDGSFSPVTFAKMGLSGVQPFSVTVTDFNKDNILDILTTDPDSDTVRVLLGTGGGNYASSASSTKAGLDPYSFVVGDFTSDGKLDIVTANYLGNSISILKGDGSGALTSLGTMPVGKSPYDIATADVNKDGQLDVLVANSDDNTVAVLAGSGTGTFTAKPTIPMTGNPQAMVIADVNNDGNPDILAANSLTSSVGVALGNGDGTFAAATANVVGNRPLSLAIADLNADGNLDVVTANYGNNNVSVLEGKGNGSFAPAWSIAIGKNPNFVTLEDVNGDGKIDIIANNSTDNTVSVILNTNPSSGSTGTDGANNLIGTAGFDALKGLGGNDTLTGLAGNDILDGGLGLDTAVYSGSRANYTVQAITDGYSVTDNTGAEGVDKLYNIDKLSFADTAMLFDTVGIPGQAYRVYKAAFDRAPDAGGLGYWINAMDKGASLQTVAEGFVNSPEFTAQYGVNPTHASFMTQLYANVLHRAYDQAGFNFWVDTLTRGANTQASVLAQMSESAENQAAVIGLIGNGIEYSPVV